MNVMCPVSRLDEFENIVNWEVQEVYFGLNNENITINNRRPNSLCNLIFDRKMLEKTAESLRKKNVEAYITFNSMVNNEQCVKYLLEEIRLCIDCGITNFIVADINLILAIRENIKDNYNLTLSTCMPVYNQRSIDFFKKLGVKRFVLPRHLLLDEIDKLVLKNSDCEFEVLIKNARCINEDGKCSFEHGLGNYIEGLEGGCCQLDYDVEYIDGIPEDTIEKEIIRKRFERIRGNFIFACGGCFLKHFYEIGVKSIKIVGREFSTERKQKDVKFITKCLKHVDYSEEDYYTYVKKLYSEIYGSNCNVSQCYY